MPARTPYAAIVAANLGKHQAHPGDTLKIIGLLVDLATLPVRIPLVEDERLDLFTCEARIHFAKEDAGNYMQHILMMALDALRGKPF